MKTKALLLTAYCIPFAFLGVFGDGVLGTMLFYAIMITGLSLLCYISLKTRNLAIVDIGNGLSFVSSYVCTRLFMEPMGDYFKPFTSRSLIIVISAVAIIIQAVIVMTFRKKSAHK